MVLLTQKKLTELTPQVINVGAKRREHNSRRVFKNVGSLQRMGEALGWKRDTGEEFGSERNPVAYNPKTEDTDYAHPFHPGAQPLEGGHHTYPAGHSDHVLDSIKSQDKHSWDINTGGGR